MFTGIELSDTQRSEGFILQNMLPSLRNEWVPKIILNTNLQISPQNSKTFRGTLIFNFFSGVDIQILLKRAAINLMKEFRTRRRIPNG